MSARIGLVAGGLVGLAIACASEPRPATAPAPTTMPGDSTAGPHDQIQQLANQIDADRVQLNLPAASPMAAAPELPAPACTRSPSETCTQTCTLSDSICRNAKQICDLANQLTGDAWAAQKCGDAKSTCGTATKRCCEC
ncbi:MAG TPA: hypothetical protein VGL61_27370 [Kofleriaceae bacterium]|jgi:hypothetical protein